MPPVVTGHGLVCVERVRLTGYAVTDSFSLGGRNVALAFGAYRPAARLIPSSG